MDKSVQYWLGFLTHDVDLNMPVTAFGGCTLDGVCQLF